MKNMSKKYENKKRKNYTLNPRVIKLIEHHTKVGNHLNHSQFLEFLIEKYNAEFDLEEQLNQLELRKKEAKKEVEKIEKQMEMIIKKMKAKKEADKFLEKDKENAIETIIKAFRRGNTMFELQEYIKTWSYRIGMSYEELSYAVALRIKEENIKNGSSVYNL